MYYNITYYWSQPVLIVLTIMVATLLLVLCEMSKMRKVKVDIQLSDCYCKFTFMSCFSDKPVTLLYSQSC